MKIIYTLYLKGEREFAGFMVLRMTHAGFQDGVDIHSRETGDGQRIIELVVDQESRALAKDGQFYYLLREFDQLGIVYEWCVGH